MTTDANDGKKPSVFISHCYSDSRIANALSSWIKRWSLGAIEVSQSLGAPQIGENLNQDLMNHLYEAQSVVLIYTRADQDWSYCMWECGIATDPKKPDTRVIVFQCAGDVPAPFQDKVRVNIHDKLDIQNFTNDFLTNSTFFPRYGQAVAPQLQADGSEVSEAADELFSKLQTVSPPVEEAPDEEWSSMPFICLEVSLDNIEQIKNTPIDRQLQATSEILSKSCIIRKSDPLAAGVFGMPTISQGMKFGDLLSIWRRNNSGANEDWIEGVQTQITQAANWQYPEIDWKLMKSANNKWYSPQLQWVRKAPSKNSMFFYIYFLPFESDEKQKHVQILIPRT